MPAELRFSLSLAWISLILIGIGWLGTWSDYAGGFFGSSFGLSSNEAFFSLLPVHDLHHLGEVLGTSILVVEVVCVLPDVHVENGHQIGANVVDQLLVVSCPEREWALSFVIYKPTPARTLDGGSPLVKDLEELINGAPTFHKGLVKWTFIRYCAINWSTEGLPEKFVVQVAASVELDQFGQRYAALEVVTSLGFCLLLEELVKVVDVGSVVLAIVKI